MLIFIVTHNTYRLNPISFPIKVANKDEVSRPSTLHNIIMKVTNCNQKLMVLPHHTRFFSFGNFLSKLGRTSTDFLAKSLHDKLKSDIVI